MAYLGDHHRSYSFLDGGLAENCNLFAFLVLLFSCIILYFFSCYGFFFLEINKELVQVERTFTGLYEPPGLRNKFNIFYAREVARCGISSRIKDEMNPQYYSYIKYEFCENVMIFCFYPYVKQEFRGTVMILLKGRLHNLV